MTENTSEERRSSSRVPLAEPCFFNLFVVGGENYKVMLNNVSAKGVQADLPAGVGSKEIPGNARVKLSGFPENMRYIEQLTGTVAWVTNGYCGIEFTQELDDDLFLEFVDSL